MVFTKRIKHTRMSSTCCWTGSQYGAGVGRKTALSRYISIRTAAKWPLVLTCENTIDEQLFNTTFTITKNTFSGIIKVNGVVAEIDTFRSELLGRTQNSISVKVFDNNSDSTAIITLQYNNNNVITGVNSDENDYSESIAILCNLVV